MAKTSQRGKLLLLLATLIVYLVACAGKAGKREVIVASAESPEQIILGTLTVIAIREAGFAVVDRTNMGPPWMVRKALAAGNVDVCWEYTGATWALHLGHDRPIADADELFEMVREEDAANNITWLPPAPSQQRLGILMLRDVSTALGLRTLSDMAQHVRNVDPDVSLCAPRELYRAPSGIRGLERVYGFQFANGNVRHMSIQDGYQALLEGECDSAIGVPAGAAFFAPDALPLDDDRGFFLASNLAVAVRSDLRDVSPLLEERLRQIGSHLTDENLASLLREVTVEGDKPKVAARRFLRKNDLLSR